MNVTLQRAKTEIERQRERDRGREREREREKGQSGPYRRGRSTIQRSWMVEGPWRRRRGAQGRGEFNVLIYDVGGVRLTERGVRGREGERERGRGGNGRMGGGSVHVEIGVQEVLTLTFEPAQGT